MKSKLKCITWVQQMYKHFVSVHPLSNKKYVQEGSPEFLGHMLTGTT